MTRQITNAEISAHELLDEEQRKLCRHVRTLARGKRESFTMLDFAQIALRAAGVCYAQADDGGTFRVTASSVADHDLRRAAILYTYEALRACEIQLITEWSEFDEMLRSLVTLAGDMP